MLQYVTHQEDVETIRRKLFCGFRQRSINHLMAEVGLHPVSHGLTQLNTDRNPAFRMRRLELMTISASDLEKSDRFRSLVFRQMF